MSKIKTAFVVAALALAGAAHASTNLVNNGTFTGNAGWYTTETATFAGWTVTSGSVDWIGTYWTAPGGNNSIDLDGNSPGTLSQSLTLAPGLYNVTFDLSANRDGGALVKYVDVSLGNAAAQQVSFSQATAGWITETLTFNVTSGTNLVFASADAGGPYGAALANVSVTAVPEAGSSAMLMAGLGLLGLMVSRRKRA